MEVVKILWSRDDLGINVEGKKDIKKDENGKETRYFTECFTANRFLEIQEKVGELDAKLAAILLSSDKTHFTNHSGNSGTWPIYMSLGNIPKKIRDQVRNEAWMTIGNLPCPSEWGVSEDVADDLLRELKAYVFHEAYRIVLDPLMQWCERVSNILS